MTKYNPKTDALALIETVIKDLEKLDTENIKLRLSRAIELLTK